MTSVSPQERYGKHLREAQPTAYGLWAVGCMDDNYPKPDDPVLGGALYYQTPGGVDGLGMDLSVAKEADRPGSVTGWPTTHRIGKLAANALHRFHYMPVNHSNCAAWGKARLISQTAARKSSAVLNRAAEINPDLTPKRYEDIVRATGAIAESRLMPTETSSAHYADHSRISPKVPIANLADTEHIAEAFVVIDTADEMFDVKSAREAGDPAYAVGLDAMAKMLHDLKKADRDIFSGISEKIFLAATAVRTSAIGTEHLLGPDGQPLPVVHI